MTKPHAAVRLTLTLLFLALSVSAQVDMQVALSPSSGPPGTEVTVDLLQGPPFSSATKFYFSFGDDLGSAYAQVPVEFTLVSPSRITFIVPAGADCGTHYFAVKCPTASVCFRAPQARTPFHVTGSCNPARRNALDVLTYNLMFLPDIACSRANPPCRDFGCFAPRGFCETPTVPCLYACDCLGHCGKSTRVDLMTVNGDLRPHDVIVFQEAFSDSHRQDLKAGLRPYYAHQSTRLGDDSGVGQDGGVMVFSKWPIEEVVNFIYPKLGCPDLLDPECQADKGVQYVRINKGGQRHHIFGTHTNAFNVAFRLNQIFEMQEFIDRTLPGRIAPGEPVIMAGDFNIDYYRAPGEYSLLINVLKAINPAKQLLISNYKGQWLDYVLYHRDYAQPSSANAFVVHPRDPRSPFRDGDLSDHYAVLGRFVFNSPGTPPPPPPPPPPGDGGGPGCTVSAPADRPVLSGPSGCFASPASLTFSWSPVAGAAEYKLAIFETTDPANETLVFYEAVPGTSFTLPFSLAPEKRYRWKVKAQNCGGPGLFSDMKWFTLSTDCRPPETAPLLSGPSGCVDAVRPNFSWSRVPRAYDYRIVVSPAAYDDFFIDQFTSETALASPVAINPQIPHRFKVRGVNDAGPGPWSEIMYFTTFCNGVAPTIGEPLGCVSTQTPTFTWDSIPPAVDYWLLVGDSPDFSAPTTTRLIDVHTSATTYPTPPGVTFQAGKTYYAKVKTILDPASTTAAAWSPTISFRPFCSPNDAAIIDQTVPASMAAGHRYNVSIKVRNTGTRIWTSGALYRLGSWANDYWGAVRKELPSSVGPGEEATFSFSVRAPATPGSYTFQWRMVEELVEWFGQVTPPVTVNVYAPRKNDASLVSQTVPTSMAAGQRYNVTIRMRNNGTATWTASALYRVGPATQQSDVWSVARVEVPHGVPPDTGATFEFIVRAPSSPGTYTFQWRMVEELVEWFGMETPPVTVNVYAAPLRNDASMAWQHVPDTMAAGGRYNVAVRMRNNGTSTWTTPGLYRLGHASSVWGMTRLELPVSVGPDTATTFRFEARAPSDPGTYLFQWRMLEEMVEWFGQASPPVQVKVHALARNDASFVAQSVPATMTAGGRYNVSVTMRNQGTAAWTPAAYYRLGISQSHIDVWGVHRVDVPASVAPGGEVTFNFAVTAPSTPGTYRFEWKMVEELKEWFGHTTEEILVRVN